MMHRAAGIVQDTPTPPRRRGAALAAALLLAVPLQAGHAAVRGEPAIAAAVQAAPAGKPIDGFRSARFGMSEAEVREAIRKDFPTAAATLAHSENLAEKTSVLSLSVADLLPKSGFAHASYIFGYKSKKLIQVNVVWNSDGKSASADQAIVATANNLRDYFAGEKLDPATVVSNRKIADTMILVFRGSDAAGHSVAVILNGTAAGARADKKPAPPALSLELAYIENAAHPDIYRIPKGMF